MTELRYVSTPRLTLSQKTRIKELQRECFSRVSREDIVECFIARGFGWVFAYSDNSIVGQIELFRRVANFEGHKILLGGLGGTCVTFPVRHRGLGSRLVKEGMKILTRNKCDIACLNANIRDYPSGGLYHRLGFRLMSRPVSFTDVYGHTRNDTGEMFVPICSEDVYELVFDGHTTFHIGRGYW